MTYSSKDMPKAREILDLFHVLLKEKHHKPDDVIDFKQELEGAFLEGENPFKRRDEPMSPYKVCALHMLSFIRCEDNEAPGDVMTVEHARSVLPRAIALELDDHTGGFYYPHEQTKTES